MIWSACLYKEFDITHSQYGDTSALDGVSSRSSESTRNTNMFGATFNTYKCNQHIQQYICLSTQLFFLFLFVSLVCHSSLSSRSVSKSEAICLCIESVKSVRLSNQTVRVSVCRISLSGCSSVESVC